MKRVRFPKRIQRGSCVVTIYRTRVKGYTSFTVVHYDAKGVRCRSTFADYPRAYRPAKEKAQSIAEGEPERITLAGAELLVYRRALQALHPTGVSLDVAVTQFAQSIQQANGTSQGAVWAGALGSQHPIKPKAAAEVLAELLEAKSQKGRSTLHLTDLRIRLSRFAEAVTKPLFQVTTDDIDGFLKSLEISARSQNNFRAAIGTLLRFGQAKAYVGRDHPGVGQVDKASHTFMGSAPPGAECSMRSPQHRTRA